MRKLEIRTSYNVTLVHLVDSTSKWDRYVESYAFDYFQKEFGITEQDGMYLADYVKIKKPLGWENETELFNWAYSNFPQSRKFDKLLPIIRYFEERKNRDGDTLKKLLVRITSQIEKNNYTQISDVFAKEWVISVKKCIELFGSETNDEVLPCYLLYSADEKSTVGGANGDGIFLELTSKDISEKKFLNDVVLHEFLHKQVTPRKYFEQNVKLFRENPKLDASRLGYPDRFTRYIEEVVVYAICDTISGSKKTRAEKIASYTERKRPEMVALWKGIADIMPVLKNYLLGKVDISTTRQLLVDYFVEKAKQSTRKMLPI